MLVILVYDINKKRVGKVLKICRKYLSHVQKSVFDGNLTKSKLKSLKEEIKKAIVFDEDSVVIYTTEAKAFIKKEQIGVVDDETTVF